MGGSTTSVSWESAHSRSPLSITISFQWLNGGWCEDRQPHSIDVEKCSVSSVPLPCSFEYVLFGVSFRVNFGTDCFSCDFFACQLVPLVQPAPPPPRGSNLPSFRPKQKVGPHWKVGPLRTAFHRVSAGGGFEVTLELLCEKVELEYRTSPEMGRGGAPSPVNPAPSQIKGHLALGRTVPSCGGRGRFFPSDVVFHFEKSIFLARHSDRLKRFFFKLSTQVFSRIKWREEICSSTPRSFSLENVSACSKCLQC